MEDTMHKVFISYHHDNDQWYKDLLIQMNAQCNLFIDGSVDTGDISDDLKAETIRQKIRDGYLRDTTVTILLCGEETRHRKHIDWELMSSMADGQKNKKSGILVITLPPICRGIVCVAHDGEKEAIYSDIINWKLVDSRSTCEELCPAMPDRITDNLIKPEARISVCPLNRIISVDPLRRIVYHPYTLSWLIDAAYRSRLTNEYDLTRRPRKHDRNPAA